MPRILVIPQLSRPRMILQTKTDRQESENAACPQKQASRLPSQAYEDVSGLFPRQSTNVLQKMFFSGALSTYSIRWTFGIWKLSGSEWYLEPVWKGDLPHNFRKPHPRGETSAYKLACPVNTLERKYAWSREPFGLARKMPRTFD